MIRVLSLLKSIKFKRCNNLRFFCRKSSLIYFCRFSTNTAFDRVAEMFSVCLASLQECLVWKLCILSLVQSSMCMARGCLKQIRHRVFKPYQTLLIATVSDSGRGVPRCLRPPAPSRHRLEGVPHTLPQRGRSAHHQVWWHCHLAVEDKNHKKDRTAILILRW